MGLSEIAEFAGVTRQAVANWRVRHSGFPAPIAVLQNGPVWKREDVLLWLKRKDSNVITTHPPIESTATKNGSSFGSFSNVAIAFDLLLEEVEDSIDALEEEIMKALQRSDFGAVNQLSNKGRLATQLREKLKHMEREWRQIEEGSPIQSALVGRDNRASTKLRRGLRTPEDSYRRPILEAVIELGGRGEVNRVLDIVGQKLGERLNEYDLAPVPSNPDEPRWRNAAKWARNTLVNEGFLAKDSPKGTWEITEKGRKSIPS